MERRNVYVGHRYVPKVMGEWDQEKNYEGLTIVTYQGTSYTSKKHVPVGIDINNEEYWVVTGNYNAQVEHYRQEVQNMQEEVDSKASKEYVDTVLTEKADKDYVDNEIDNTIDKINKISYLASDFGVKADGVTSDSTALKNAIESSQNNKLILPEGTIKIDQEIRTSLSGDVEIEGRNTEIVIDADTATGSQGTLYFDVPQESQMQVPSIIEENSNAITLNSLPDVQKGDLLVIRNSETYAERRGTGQIYYKGFVTVVEEVIGTTIVTKDKFPFDFDPNYNTTVTVYKPVKVKLSGIRFKILSNDINKVDNITSLLSIAGAVNSELNNISFENGTTHHLIINRSYNLKIDNLDIKGNLEKNISLNYGVSVYLSNYVFINNYKAKTLRHCIDLSGHPPSNVIIDNSSLYSDSGFSIGCHSAYSYEVRNSELMNGAQLGFNHATFINCHIENYGQFVIYNRADAGQYMRSVKLKDCVIKHNGAEFNNTIFQFANLSNLEFCGLIMMDNCEIHHAENSLNSVVSLEYLSKFEDIGDIVIKNCDFYTAVSGYFIRTYNESSIGIPERINKRDLVIENNKFHNKTNSGTPSPIRMITAMKLFKNIIIKNNDGLKSGLNIDINGANDQGKNSGDVFILNNEAKESQLRLRDLKSYLFVKGNSLLDLVGAIELLRNGNVTVVNNMIENNHISLDQNDMSIYGFNRRLDDVESTYGYIGSPSENIETNL